MNPGWITAGLFLLFWINRGVEWHKLRRKYESLRTLQHTQTLVIQQVTLAYEHPDPLAMEHAVKRCRSVLENLPKDAIGEPDA